MSETVDVDAIEERHSRATSSDPTVYDRDRSIADIPDLLVALVTVTRERDEAVVRAGKAEIWLLQRTEERDEARATVARAWDEGWWAKGLAQNLWAKEREANEQNPYRADGADQ